MLVPAAVASRSKTVRGVATVPIFQMAPQVKLPKRLDLAQDVIAAQDALSGQIVTNWGEKGSWDKARLTGGNDQCFSLEAALS